MRNTTRLPIAVLTAAIGFSLSPACTRRRHQVLPHLRTPACPTIA